MKLLMLATFKGYKRGKVVTVDDPDMVKWLLDRKYAQPADEHAPKRSARRKG